MGGHVNISHDKFPKQGKWLHRAVRVCFNYDAAFDHMVNGLIVRDDDEAPYITIIALDLLPDQAPRFVLTTECQYSLVPEEKP